MSALKREHALIAALRAVEAHHVALNRSKGRPESRSTTLRIVREALALIPDDQQPGLIHQPKVPE